LCQPPIVWGLGSHLAATFFLAGAICVVYGRALSSPFIFDDRKSVLENPSIINLWPPVAWSAQGGPLNPPRELPTSGRPLVNLSLALNYQLGRLDPAGYHLVNVIVHLLSALLLASIVRKTLRLAHFSGYFERTAGMLALGTALIWAVHPLQTEPVVYVSQRSESLMGFFYLATLYGSLRFWLAQTKMGRALWLWFAAVACGAGMGCKEAMFSAPLVILLYERTFIAASFKHALQRSWPLHTALFATWSLLAYLNYDQPRSMSAGFHLGVPAHEWWFTQAKVIFGYLKLVAWPSPLLIHYDIPYSTRLATAWPWLFGVALIGTITVALSLRRHPAGFVGAIFFLILSPTLIVPIVTEVAAERRMYLPLAALVALIVVGAYWVAGRTRLAVQLAANEKSAKLWSAMAFGTLVATLVFVLGIVSSNRVGEYRDEIALWAANLAHQPNDALAHNHVGSQLVAVHRTDEAIQHYTLALQLKPDYTEAYNNLGAAFLQQGRLPEAIDAFQHALRLKADYADALNNLGLAFFRTGQTQEAIDRYRQAVALKTDFAVARCNLATALVSTGHNEEAIEQCEEALQIKPDYSQAHYTIACALLALGRLEEAIDHFRESLALRPSAETHLCLANALYGLGETEEAIEEYREAIKLRPGYAEAHNNLGAVLLNGGRAEQALEHFENALKLRADYADAWANLEAVFKTLRPTLSAVATAQRTQALAKAHGQERINETIQVWLNSNREKSSSLPPLSGTN
jgi:protein O-mannosyl-transferase